MSHRELPLHAFGSFSPLLPFRSAVNTGQMCSVQCGLVRSKSSLCSVSTGGLGICPPSLNPGFPLKQKVIMALVSGGCREDSIRKIMGTGIYVNCLAQCLANTTAAVVNSSHQIFRKMIPSFWPVQLWGELCEYSEGTVSILLLWQVPKGYCLLLLLSFVQWNVYWEQCRAWNLHSGILDKTL